MKSALVLACDDKFIPFTSVVARRIAHHASEKFPILVLSDGVSDENKARAQSYCPRITFIEAAPLLEGHTLPPGSRFTRAAYLRLTLDDILADFDHAVYLDSDISPLADVSPLLALRPKAAPVIAAYDLVNALNSDTRTRLGMSEGAPCFNSGVVAIDLNAVRNERIFADALEFARQHPDRCLSVDQDALNVVLDGRWQVLDWRWNAMTYRTGQFPSAPFIRHFASTEKPWSANKRGIERHHIEQWRTDLAQSPWPGQFQAEQPRNPITTAAKPYLAAAEDMMRTLVNARRDGPRGIKARFSRHFARALKRIETAAGQEQLAVRFPEVALVE